MKTTLKLVPFTIDADAIAIGLIDMFDEESITVLRFGMIPEKFMAILRRLIEEKFRSFSTTPTGTEDHCIAITELVGHRHIEFSMKKLVSEAEHLVCRSLYKHGNLVV